MISITVLYGVNRFFLIPASSGVLHDLLAWHGADALAGALMLCILNVLLIAAKRLPVRHLLPVTLFLLGCCIFWEVITPLYLSRSVGDPWDIVACWLGGTVMYVVDKKKSSA